MKFAAPKLPENWQLQRLDDGSAQATIIRKPAGWALASMGFVLSISLSVASHGPHLWFVALLLFLALLIYLTDQLVHGTYGAEIWHFSKSGLNVRKTVFGIGWWNVEYFHGTLSIVSAEGATWDLRFQSATRLYSLFSSSKLDEVLALAAFLEEELDWPLQVTEAVPPFFRQLVKEALAANDRKRLQFLVQDERLVVMLVLAWRELGSLYRPGLRGMLRSLEAETSCLSALVERAEPASRAGAIELLGELGDERTLPVLRRALEDASGPVRVQAAQALGRLRDRDAVVALCTSLQYAPELRIAAVRALGEIGEPSAIEALAELLIGSGRTMDVECRLAVVTALGRIKDPAAVPVLGAVLHDAVPDIREAAAEALGEIGASEAVPSLLPALRDPVERVALRVVVALGRIRQPDALPDLVRALSDRQCPSVVRAAAARAVAATGGASAVQALCEALTDSASSVRYEAAAGLNRVVGDSNGSPIELRAALPRLRRLSAPLSKESAEVKHACRDAIRRIERDTETIKQLPLPAEGSTAPSTLLPLPAEPIVPNTESARPEEYLLARPGDGR